MKLLSGLLTTFLIALGLTLVSSPAEAVYPKSVPTTSFARAVDPVITTTQDARFRFRATAAGAGNAAPTGTVLIRVVNKRTGVTVKRAERSYEGGTETWNLGKIRKRGRYSVRFYLRTGPNSVFKNSWDPAFLRVIRG